MSKAHAIVVLVAADTLYFIDQSVLIYLRRWADTVGYPAGLAPEDTLDLEMKISEALKQADAGWDLLDLRWPEPRGESRRLTFDDEDLDLRVHLAVARPHDGLLNQPVVAAPRRSASTTPVAPCQWLEQ